MICQLHVIFIEGLKWPDLYMFFLYMKKNHQVKWSFTSKQLNDTIVFLVINYPVFSVVSLLLYHSIVAVKWPHDLIWLDAFRCLLKNNQEK